MNPRIYANLCETISDGESIIEYKSARLAEQ